MNCSWKLIAPANNVIRLTINEVSFPKCMTQKKANDYIDVYDGDSKYAAKIVDRFSQCSLSKSIDLVSRSNLLLVVFTSTSSRGSKGFQGIYDSILKDKGK